MQRMHLVGTPLGQQVVRHRWWLLLGFLILVVILGLALRDHGQSLPFTTLDQGIALRPYPQAQTPELYVIADISEVNQFATRLLKLDPSPLDRRYYVAEQLRQLDYAQVFALIVFHGERGSGGYQVTIQDIKQSGDRVLVRANFDRPGWREGRPPIFTDPYHLVSVAKSHMRGKQMTFVLESKWQRFTETVHFIP